jgi:hypothetical protein
MKLNLQAELTRTTKTWQSEGAIKEAALERGWSYTGSRALYGKTVGLLGYGHIARETARLFKAFHCRIIAATSNGSKRPATGVRLSSCRPDIELMCSTRWRAWGTKRVSLAKCPSAERPTDDSQAHSLRSTSPPVTQHNSPSLRANVTC